jgi:hypothetical protein
MLRDHGMRMNNQRAATVLTHLSDEQLEALLFFLGSHGHSGAISVLHFIQELKSKEKVDAEVQRLKRDTSTDET